MDRSKTRFHEVLQILNEQRKTGEFCDIILKLGNDFQLWGHFASEYLPEFLAYIITMKFYCFSFFALLLMFQFWPHKAISSAVNIFSRRICNFPYIIRFKLKFVISNVRNVYVMFLIFFTLMKLPRPQQQIIMSI